MSQAPVNPESKSYAVLEALYREPGDDGGSEDLRELLDDLRRVLDGHKVKPTGSVAALDAQIAHIDKLLSAQVDEILHHPEFQALEASWRGIDGLVRNALLQAGKLELKVLNISKEELIEHFVEYNGPGLVEGHLYKQLYGQNLGRLGGAPVGAIVADYFFNPMASDELSVLQGLASIGAACHAPALTSAAPEMFGVTSWDRLQSRSEQSIRDHFATSPRLNKWRSFKKTDEAQYLGLTALRVLGREAYTAQREHPPKNFRHREETGGRPENFLWVNGVYPLAECILGAFAKYGWPVQFRGMESGGLLERLPQQGLGTYEGDDDLVGPVEVSITQARSKTFTDMGFIAPEHVARTADAVFLGAPSVQEPGEFSGPNAVAATENAKLHANLPYTFAAARILHNATCLARRKIGSLAGAEDLRRLLQNWLDGYILADLDATTTEDAKRRKPLADGTTVTVTPIDGQPGYFEIKIDVRVHLQFEGAIITASMKSRVKKS